MTKEEFAFLAIRGFGLGFCLGFMLWAFCYAWRTFRSGFLKIARSVD